MPTFSIVIPTRNRAPLLRYALASALEQRFDDYEIVVCDNCSNDGTTDVVRELAHPRIRYHRSDRPLSMPDNWELALGHARGEYVTYLSDDDAISPSLLSTVARAIERSGARLIGWNSALYMHATWARLDQRNTLRLNPCTHRLVALDTREVLAPLYDLSLSPPRYYPKMLDSACHREVLDTIRRRASRIFKDPCPDYSFAALALGHVPRLYFIDSPLLVFGFSKDSIGAAMAFTRGEAHRRFVREFQGSRWLPHVPLRTEVITNFVTETLLAVQETCPDRLGPFAVNWERYFILCALEIRTLGEGGVNVDPDQQEWESRLRQHPAAFQRHVRQQVRRLLAVKKTRGIARRLLDRLPLLSRMITCLPGRWRAPLHVPTVLRGASYGFSNILECARFLERLPGSPDGTTAPPHSTTPDEQKGTGTDTTRHEPE